MNEVYEGILSSVAIPRMYRIRQKFIDNAIGDIAGAVEKTLSRVSINDKIWGKTIAVAVGSRGITHLPLYVKTIITFLKENHCKVFIVPSMGSHGGAIAKNQKSILEHLGVSEQSMGVEIRASMQTVEIGKTVDGVPVYMDKNAAGADYTVTIARIKPHCSFRGKYESGMLKMCVIGLGKQKGADYCHMQGMANMGKNIEKIGRVFIEKSNLLFSLGIIENSFDEPCFIEAIPKEQIFEREPLLLAEAKSYLPRIPFNSVDLLVVDEIGKNITGTGMDCNIIQRFTSEHMVSSPFIKRIVVLDITPESDGNFAGMGLADVTTERAYRKMDKTKTYPNFMTSRTAKGAMMPMIMDDDYDAIRTGIKTAPDVDYKNLKIVRIKNTMRMDMLDVSEAMIEDVKSNALLEIISGPNEWKFDGSRTLDKGVWR